MSFTTVVGVFCKRGQAYQPVTSACQAPQKIQWFVSQNHILVLQHLQHIGANGLLKVSNEFRCFEKIAVVAFPIPATSVLRDKLERYLKYHYGGVFQKNEA